MELTFACTTARDAIKGGIFEWMHHATPDDLRRNSEVLAHLVFDAARAVAAGFEFPERGGFHLSTLAPRGAKRLCCA